MLDEDISDKLRRELRDRFESTGLSVVHEHLSSNADSWLVDRPRGVNVREIARAWATEQLKAKRSSRRRNDILFIVGTVVAILAAMFGFIALL